MNQLAKRLKTYRKRKQLSQQEVSMYLGYKSFTTIQKWEDGTSEPSLSILEKLCELYEVSFNVLVNGAPPNITIPLLGEIRAGNPIYAQEIYNQESEILDMSDTFYLKVIGDSMKDARIHDGDEILVKSTSKLEQGRIGVVLIEDEATVKRIYRKQGKLILQPENASYEPMVFTAKEIEEKRIRILGEVIENKIKIK